MTGEPMVRPQYLEFGLLEQTYVLAFVAAGMEGTSGRGIQGTGHVTRKNDSLLLNLRIGNRNGRKQGLGVRMKGVPV